jgi:hypothetical protein
VPADNARVPDASAIARQLQRDGYAVIPGLLDQEALAAARAELGPLLDVAGWGSGFDGTRTKRAWAPLAVTRCPVNDPEYLVSKPCPQLESCRL